MCKADAGQARRRILLAEAVRWARATAFADSRLTALGAGGSRHSPLESMGQSSMNMITTKDGVELYYKDWGPKDGPVVTISPGWPRSSDSWEGTEFRPKGRRVGKECVSR